MDSVFIVLYEGRTGVWFISVLYTNWRKAGLFCLHQVLPKELIVDINAVGMDKRLELQVLSKE